VSARRAGDYLSWRARLIAGLDRVLDHGSRHQKDKSQGQELLFGGGDVSQVPDDDAALPATRAWTETQALAGEKESLGLYMSGTRSSATRARSRSPARGDSVR
jgi:DNA polymerase-3 subunit alpha